MHQNHSSAFCAILSNCLLTISSRHCGAILSLEGSPCDHYCGSDAPDLHKVSCSFIDASSRFAFRRHAHCLSCLEVACLQNEALSSWTRPRKRSIGRLKYTAIVGSLTLGDCSRERSCYQHSSRIINRQPIRSLGRCPAGRILLDISPSSYAREVSTNFLSR